MKSLGLLEISGVTAAVTALDIMCKTADVEFVTWERKLGGRLVTIIVQGDVAAVRQAVESAAAGGIKEPVNYPTRGAFGVQNEADGARKGKGAGGKG